MKRSKNIRGESISEALIAVLIAALGGLLVASSILASGHSMSSSDAKMQTYYSRLDTLAEESNPKSAEASMAANDNTPLTAFSTNINVNVYSDETDEPSFSVYSVNSK